MELGLVLRQAIEILRGTRDGGELSPPHLKLVELAVNGLLNQHGEQVFADLYEQVSEGRYHAPWFHGIEHLTRNHQGYVLWRGIEVEHYSSPWCYSDEAKAQAEEIARRCRILEAKGETPGTGNVVWAWEDEAAVA